MRSDVPAVFELDMSDGVVQLRGWTECAADVSNMRPFVTPALSISHDLWVSGGKGR